MGSIQTGIEMQDQFSNVLMSFINSMTAAVTAANNFSDVMNQNINTSSLSEIRNEIEAVSQELNTLSQSAETPVSPTVSADVQSVQQINEQIEQTQGLLQRVSNIQQQLSTESQRFDVLPEDARAQIQEVNESILQMRAAMDQVTENPFDMPTDAVEAQLASLQSRIRQTIQEQLELNETLSNMDIERVQQPPPVQIPVEWRADSLDVFTNTGVDRFRQEIQSANAMLEQLSDTQNEMNSAIDRMDVQNANSAYLQLSQTISNTERYIRDNVNEQGEFNETINKGTENANNLLGTIKGAIAAYANVNTVTSALNASDELMQTRSKLNLMNDGLQSTDDLVNMAYIAAQDARGEFGAMTSVIARFGNNAKDAFGSSAEVVQFAGLVQKQMTIAGASTSEASNAMLQLSQALGSGVLRGDELNSIFENAPNLIQNIADYLNVPIGKIREMAADGEISADIVKQAIFAATDKINADFESMPMTWGQVWTSMQNTATMAFQPILNYINRIANSRGFQMFTANVGEAMSVVSGTLGEIFEMMGATAQFATEHWDVLSPVIYTVVGALGAYLAVLAVYNTFQAISTVMKIAATVASYIHAAATNRETVATFAQTAAQHGLNAALLSCPVTWIILAIIALIAVVVALTTHLAGMGSMATTTFGTITGGVNVVIQFFKNLGVSFANISLGIAAAASALGENIMTAFHNAIKSVQVWLYDLLSSALTTIAGICEALNELPFVEFDYSGVTNAADLYATASAEAANDKREYVSIGDAFLDAAQTYDAFQDGWIDDAYRKGAEWGDGVSDKISRALKGIKTDIPDQGDYPNAIASSGNKASEIAKNTGDTAKSAQKAVQALDITGENLKYIKDLAEREYINRFTTAKIYVKQTNHNNVNNNMDLDGINEYLRSDLEQRMAATAEGVHQ